MADITIIEALDKISNATKQYIDNVKVDDQLIKEEVNTVVAQVQALDEDVIRMLMDELK